MTKRVTHEDFQGLGQSREALLRTKIELEQRDLLEQMRDLLQALLNSHIADRFPDYPAAVQSRNEKCIRREERAKVLEECEQELGSIPWGHNWRIFDLANSWRAEAARLREGK